jgi:hypothetical protein
MSVDEKVFSDFCGTLERLGFHVMIIQATTGNPLSFQRGADLSVLLHKKRRQYFVY